MQTLEEKFTPGKIAPSGLAKDLLRVAIVCVAFTGLLEIGLRLSGMRMESSFYQIDPVRDYSYRPGAHGWHTRESDVYVRINGDGNRDVPRSVDAVPGTLRIAVLGSSTAAGMEVEQRQMFQSLLEQMLSQPGRKVEVLNFGVEGFGAAQDYYTLQEKVWKYHPQIVMEDVSLKQYVLKCSKKYNREHDPYPYFVVTPSGVLPDPATERIHRPTAKEVSRSNLVRSMVNSLDLSMLVSEVREHLNIKLQSMLGRRASETQMISNPLTDSMRWTLIAPPHPEIAQAWMVLEGLELAIRKDVEAHGAEYWVISSEDQFQVNPNPAVGEKLREQMGAADLNYGDDRFKAFLTANQMNFIVLKDPMQDYVRATGAYLHGGVKVPAGDGHWNVLGQRVVAEIIGDRLREQSKSFQRWQAGGADGQTKREGSASKL